jgi:hypothetical protein
MITRFLVYLSCSAAFEENHFWNEAFKPCKPVAFYKRGYEDSLGAKFFFGSHKTDKAFVVLAGKALANYRDAGRQEPDTLAWLLGKSGVFGRVDIAVTDMSIGENIQVDAAKRWFEKKLIESPLAQRGAKFISGYDWNDAPIVETFYVGELKKRGDVGIFRAYDKSLDLGIGNGIITRIELEIRKEKANSVARRLSQDYDLSGNFRASFDVRSSDFERLMDSPAIVPVRGVGLGKIEEQEKNDKRWEWLIGVVSKSLNEAIDSDLRQGLGTKRAYEFLEKSGFDARAIIFMLERKQNRR